MVSFAQTMVSTRDPNLKVEVPTFTQFLLKLYKRAAQSIEMRSMRYFRMSYFEQDIFLKDVMRVTMNSCLMLRVGGTVTPVVAQPESSVLQGAIASSRNSSASVTTASAATHSTAPRQRAHGILPADSVSNAPPPSSSAAAAPRRKKAERPRSMLTTMSEQSSSSEHSDFSLRKYKQQLNARKAKPFHPPSFVSTKEVDLTPTPDAPPPSNLFRGTGCASDLPGYSTLSRR
jgi:hypothetical protein